MRYVIDIDSDDVIRVLCGMESGIVNLSKTIEHMEACEYPCAGQKMVRQLVIRALINVTNQIQEQTPEEHP